MAIPSEALAEIRARIPLSDLVGRKVKLRKAGREMKGLSPFNQEKTPSFFVNDQKGFYHCFSSGEHGDHFDWLIKTEGLTFPEAAEHLAEEVGITLAERTPEERANYALRMNLHDVLDEAQRYFQTILWAPQGRAALEILKDRGLNHETIIKFGLGLASDTGLKRHLHDCSISNSEMTEAGLITEDGRERFRNRIMFPIMDPRGRVVAFSGRSECYAQPKYLNSPETPIFVKGRTLFNFHRAREASVKTGTVIVVEGNMDVLSLWQAGFENVVAPLGTAVTIDQLEMVWRLVPDPIICFDGDSAGLRAASRTLDLALPHLETSKLLRFASMPLGEDPDSLVRRDSLLMARVVEQARWISEALWDREAYDISTPEKRARAQKALRQATDQIEDPILRRNMEQGYIRRIREAGYIPYKRPLHAPPSPSTVHKERALAAILAVRHDLVDQHLDQLSRIDIKNREARTAIDLALGQQPVTLGDLWATGRLKSLLAEDPLHPDVDRSFRELLDMDEADE